MTNLFISYKRNITPDEPLAKRLSVALKQAGHQIFIDQSMKIGTEWAKEIEHQISTSDFMLVLLSESSIHSEMVCKEVEYAHANWTKSGKSRLLPVRVNYTDHLPYQLSHYLEKLQYAEWHISPGQIAQDTQDIFVAYEAALETLLKHLRSSGHPDYDTALTYEQRLRENIARSRLHGDTPIRESDRSVIIAELNKLALTTLNRSFNDLCREYIPLSSSSRLYQQEDEKLIRQILDAINDPQPSTALPYSPQPPLQDDSRPIHPLPYADPRPYVDPEFIESLHAPGGAVRIQSEFYVERNGEQQLCRELSKNHGTTTTIRAARQTGKTSLLIRGIHHARKQRSKIVHIDLQPVDESHLESLDTFLHYIAQTTVAKLRLDRAEVAHFWDGSLGATDKLTFLMEDYVLVECDKVLLALDEADRLLRTSFHDTFFGMIRSWHNNRASNDLWENMNIAMVISTEPHLLIGDVMQSPFNVGNKIRLEDFSSEQVWHLNQCYHTPLSVDDLSDMMHYLNGHPYLTQRALYTMVTEHISWDKLKAIAITDQSPFGDHLRRYQWLLSDQPELIKALKHVFRRGCCPDEVSYYRLFQAGLIRGVSSDTCSSRCELYEHYLKDRLK